MHHPFELTKDGFETHMQVNYLSHYLLIKELQEVLSGGKVVFTTSSLYKNSEPRFVANYKQQQRSGTFRGHDDSDWLI